MAGDGGYRKCRSIHCNESGRFQVLAIDLERRTSHISILGLSEDSQISTKVTRQDFSVRRLLV